MTKEAYIYDKRGLHIWQKRPTYMAKEAYMQEEEEGLFKADAVNQEDPDRNRAAQV